VNQISREQLNGFAPHSQVRLVSSLAQTSLNVKVKGQRSKSKEQKRRYALQSPPAVTEWNALAANNITQQWTAAFVTAKG